MPYNINSSQANDQYESILNALDKVYSDTTLGDMGNALNTKPSQRHADNGIGYRQPWIMSTTEWLLENPPRGIAWEVNPSDVTWQLAQRSTHSKTLLGTVLHVWPNSGRGTFFDEFRLTLNLQSGNLMPIYMKDQGKFIPSGGIVNFYDFMQLVDAPKLTVGDAKSPPRTNMVIIQYSSNLFPQLTLMGMFDPSGIKFTDTSNDPNNVNGWSVDFIVYDTSPKLSSNNGEQRNARLLDIYRQERIPEQSFDTVSERRAQQYDQYSNQDGFAVG